MNKKIYIILSLTFALFFLSCEGYLDKLPDGKQTEQEVFSKYKTVDELVTHVYEQSKIANKPLGWFYHFSSAAITDECEGTTVEGSITNNFNTGAWNTNTLPGSNGQYWWDLYKAIRKVNVVIEGVEKYNTPDNPIEPGLLEKRVGEAYFHRAYLHWCLLKIYGEAPYIDYVIDPYQSMDFKQESVHSLVAKIEADAMESYKRVPHTWSGIDFGRVDKGACLGLIATVKWIAATPLWNGAKDKGYAGTRIFEDEYGYKKERWEAARDAAKAVLDAKNADGKIRYNLFEKYAQTDYNDSGGLNTSNSTVNQRLWQMYYDMEAYQEEAVWFVTKDKGDGWFGDVYPPSRGGGARQQPVQEQVDEYEYIAPDGYGYPIYASRAEADGYDDKNPYVSVKRDPRFYRDVIFHGAHFRGRDNQPSRTNTASGSDEIGGSNATTTGYYLRKYLHEAWNRDGGVSISAPPVWRLPDFIYIYAEAVNELSGPTPEIYDMVNKVRARSFMAPMPAATKSDQALMREYIYRERRVEFFYENKRAFDCRLYLEPSSKTEMDKEAKWKASGSTNNARSKNYWATYKTAYPKAQRMINGMRPIEDPNGKIVIEDKKYSMERYCVEERVFDAPRHYLFPLMDEELLKTPTLKQNPEW